jgi:hypothetical protein
MQKQQKFLLSHVSDVFTLVPIWQPLGFPIPLRILWPWRGWTVTFTIRIRLGHLMMIVEGMQRVLWIGGIHVEHRIRPIFLLRFISLFLVILSFQETFIAIAVTVVFIVVFIAIPIIVLLLTVFTTSTSRKRCPLQLNEQWFVSAMTKVWL